MRGFSVFTRPSRISGKPVYSSIARMSIPASASSRAVPPVETISTPSSASPRAKSTRPRLSETVRSARRIRTAPGWVTSGAVPSVVPIVLLDHDVSGVPGIDPHPSACNQPHRPRQQTVLDLVDVCPHGGDVTRIRDGIEGLLQDDRPAVDPLVDEVDRDPHQPHPVGERLVDRVHAREGRQQGGVDVDDPPGEALYERGAEQLHEAREDHEVDAPLRKPVAEGGIALLPAPVAPSLENARLDAGIRCSRESARIRVVRPDGDDLDPLTGLHRVDQRLEVRSLARDEDAHAEAHRGTVATRARSTGYGPPLVPRRSASISSSMRLTMSTRRISADVP